MVESKEIRQKTAKESREFGLETSKKNSLSLFDIEPRELELAWIVKTQLPFSYHASKNSLYGRTQENGKFLRKESKAYRNTIAMLIKNAMRGVDIKHTKLWIDIYVEKPNNRGDAINVMDLVCDAIKMVVPVDDRWYAIRRLDWSINKHDPQLFICLSQEIGAQDSKACHLCGFIKPLANFTISRDSKDGRDGTCKSCRLRIPDEELAKYPNRRTWR